MSTPVIDCFDATPSSITIRITAGATGAPAGFTVQWMTLADFQANGNVWPSGICDASFSGMPQCSQYNIQPNQSITVEVGDNAFDACGESSTCANVPLQCGTQYVFRAFAHANSTYQRSDFSSTLTCSTDPCGGTGDCTFTQGYWKTHGPLGCQTGNNTNQWPQSVQDNGLTLGSVTYTQDQLCSILNTPAQGNGLIALAHQLIAAKINIANGADATDIQASIDGADALIGNLVVPPVGTGSLPSSSTSTLTNALAPYNEGETGPGHCP